MDRFSRISCMTSIISVALCVPSLAVAQNVSAVEDKTLERGDAIDTVDGGTAAVRSDGPAQRSAYGPRLPSFEIDANEEGSEATFTISAGGVDAKEQAGRNGFYRVTRHNLTLKGSFPISSQGDGENAFNFGRLGNFEKIEGGFTYYSSVIGVGNGNGILLNSAVKACVVRTIDDNSGRYPDWEENKAEFLGLLVPAARGELLVDIIDDDEILEGENDPLSAEKFKEMREELKKQCIPESNGVGFIREYSGDNAAKAFRDSTFDKKPILFAGVNGNVGRQEFKFVDVVAFSEQTVKKTPWSANAFVGWIASDYQWAARIQYSYQSKFESAEEDEECRPSTTDPTMQDCLKGPIGLPLQSKTSVASLELRKRFNLLYGDKKLPIGIAPQFTYDFEKKDFGIDVPVYFTSNSDGKLNGGIRFGYRSDEKDFGVGLFVGVPFRVPF